MAGLIIVLGTRPEAIKLVPVIQAFRTIGLRVRVCVTGQHRELVDGVLRAHDIAPDFDLDLMRPAESLARQMGGMVALLGAVFEAERPDRVIVQGDTATALAAAQAAYFTGIPVAHVEAGLRTGDLHNPYPEEGNRKMIAAIADMHFAPTKDAAEALLKENVPAESIHISGNTIVDAVNAAMTSGLTPSEVDVALSLNGNAARKLLVVTCHRRENWSRLDGLMEALTRVAGRSDVLVAFPVHPNPILRDRVHHVLGSKANIVVMEPLNFRPFLALCSRAYLILTDSGGVQEEATVLGVPTLLLRDRTERPEGVSAGTVRMVGTRASAIEEAVVEILDKPLVRQQMARRHRFYGEGQAATHIARVIAAAHDRVRGSDRALRSVG